MEEEEDVTQAVQCWALLLQVKSVETVETVVEAVNTSEAVQCQALLILIVGTVETMMEAVDVTGVVQCQALPLPRRSMEAEEIVETMSKTEVTVATKVD